MSFIDNRSATPSEFDIFTKLANPNVIQTNFMASVQKEQKRATPKRNNTTRSSNELENISSEDEGSFDSGEEDIGDDQYSSDDDIPSNTFDSPSDRREYSSKPKASSRFTSTKTSMIIDRELMREVNREKQGYLFQLRNMSHQGMKLTKTYTMDDSLEDLQFEYDRQIQIQNTRSAVNMMKAGLQIIFRIIEVANRKFGPFLDLDGWNDHIGADIRRRKFDNVLEKLYKKHWRKGRSTSPEMELLTLVGTSMITYHFSRKCITNNTPSTRSGSARKYNDVNDGSPPSPAASGGGGGLPFGNILGMMGSLFGGGLGGSASGGMNMDDSDDEQVVFGPSPTLTNSKTERKSIRRKMRKPSDGMLNEVRRKSKELDTNTKDNDEIIIDVNE